MVNTKTKKFEIVITKEHLADALQAYLSRYGYFEGEDNYYEISGVSELPDGTLEIVGKVD